MRSIVLPLVECQFVEPQIKLLCQRCGCFRLNFAGVLRSSHLVPCSAPQGFPGFALILLPEFATERSLNVKGGAYIHQIVPGGSAAQKGLAVGDIMSSLNGQPISNMPEFVAVRDRAIQGKPLLAEYLRLEGNQFQRYSKSVNNLMEVELMPI